MKLQLFTVDAFTEKTFHGNPAAVVILKQKLDDAVLQQIAIEMNLSETAFLSPPGFDQTFSWTAEKRFGLRWFTPTNEVLMCGHATLASAHVLFSCIGNSSEVLEFNTLSGVLMARRHGKQILLDFPQNFPNDLTEEESRKFQYIVKTTAGDREVKTVLFAPVIGYLLVRLSDEISRSEFEAIIPSSQELMTLQKESKVNGVFLTTKGDGDNVTQRGFDGYDFVSRFFDPWNGIPEDPVTGSAHTVLGPYWAKELDITSLRCRQCSPRGGDLSVTVKEDGRVHIVGGAITVIEGVINIQI